MHEQTIQGGPPITDLLKINICLFTCWSETYSRQRGAKGLFFSLWFTSHIDSPKPLSFNTCLCFGLSLEWAQNKVLNFLHRSSWVSLKFGKWHLERRILSWREALSEPEEGHGRWMGKRNKRASHLWTGRNRMSSELSGYLLYGSSHCSLAFKQAQIVASVLLTNGVFIRSLCLFAIHIKNPPTGSHHEWEGVFKFMYHSRPYIWQNLSPD